jgi:hydrogenase maturation factor
VTSACGDDGHCITCSDEGIPMRVVEAPTAALALCAGADGARSEVMTDLVGEVAPGDRVLVHAGVALTRLE